MPTSGNEDSQDQGDQSEDDWHIHHSFSYDQGALPGANITEHVSQQNDQSEQRPSISGERSLSADQESEVGTADGDSGLSENQGTFETVPRDTAEVSQQGPGTQQIAEASQQQDLAGDRSNTLLPEGHVIGSQPMAPAQAASEQLAADATVPTPQNHHAAQSVGHTIEAAETQASLTQQTQQAQQTEAVPVDAADHVPQTDPAASETAEDSSSATEQTYQQDIVDSNHDGIQDASAQQQNDEL